MSADELASLPAFESIGLAEGLPSGTVRQVYVDRHGFVWFAGNNGIHRYDGHTIFSFDRDPARPDSLASRLNIAIAETGDALWVASADGTLQRLRADAASFERVLPQPSVDGRLPSRVEQMLSDAAGRLWLVTELGLLRYDTHSGTTRAVGLPMGPAHRITQLAWSQERRQLIVATTGGELMVVDAERPERQMVIPLAQAGPVWGLAVDGEALWLASEHRLWRHALDAGDVVEVALDHPLRQPDRMVVDRRGVVWIGSTSDEGLVRYDPASGRSRLFRPNPADPLGLLSNRIMSLAVDTRGDLWIGLLRGGAQRIRLSGAGMERFHAAGSASQSFCALHSPAPTRLIVSLCGGGLGELDLVDGGYRDLTPELERHLTAPAPALTAHALFEDGVGGLWVPSTREGLLHWRRQEDALSVYPLHAQDGSVIASPYMSDAVMDAEGRIWVGSTYGLARLDPGGARLQLVGDLELADGRYAGVVHSILPEADGALWLGTNGGLIRYRPLDGQGRAWSHDPYDQESLSDNRVLSLHRSPDGTLWIGTQAGLNRMEQADFGRVRFRRFGPGEGLPDQTIDALASDRSGSLWVGTDHGLARLDAGSDRFLSLPLAPSRPASSINKGAVLSAEDGSLYFGSFTGLWRVRPDRVRPDPPGPLMLSRYELGGNTTINFGGPVAVPLETAWNVSRVEFSVAATGGRQQLAYRLAGFDRDWLPMPDSNTVSYPRLGPGQYRFEVSQHRADGGWAEPGLVVPLTVHPPPWRSPWALGVYVVALVLFASLMLRAQRDRLRSKRRHLRELSERDRRLMLALWASQDVMLELRPDSGEILHLGEHFLGYPCPALPLHLDGYLDMVHPADRSRVQTYFRSAGGEDEADLEYRLRAADREWIWVRLRGRVVERAEGSRHPTRFTGMVSNISAERRSREQLRRMANYDPLTGLPNRSRFNEELSQRLAQAGNRRLALLFIDLDRFKNINDSLGHQFGDRVLVAAARRLARALPEGAYLARLGGDEFTALLATGDDPRDAARVARNLLEAFAEPLAVDGSEVVVTLSIGISLHPDHAQEPTLLLQYADSAMYHAKDSGRNAWRYFHPDMIARVSRRLALETGLRRALAQDELSCVYQPRLDLREGTFCGVEVLLRWHSPEHGEVPPDEFVPILEDTGLIEEVGLWLVGHVCRQGLAWRADGLPDFPLSVNLSVHQLMHGNLADRMARLFAEHGVPPGMLELEITESAVMQNAEHMRVALAELKALGLGLSIDDFGTGYSSFAYLARLNVDTLKIDKTFIDGVGSRESADTLCAAMIAMAHNLRLRVVAEGVETPQQLEALRAMGCDEVQGFHYARPMTAEALEAFLVRTRAVVLP